MSARPGLEWSGLMRAGLHDLRLTPDQFWSLTPAELAMMLGLEAGPAPMSRDRLADLSRLYPDKPATAPAEQAKGEHDAHR